MATKIIVQNLNTQKFAGMEGNWTPELEEARAFSSVADAFSFCSDLYDARFEIRIIFASGASDLVLPVPQYHKIVDFDRAFSAIR